MHLHIKTAVGTINIEIRKQTINCVLRGVVSVTYIFSHSCNSI